MGPLLRRRGTSPALGASLRKALGALDKSLGGLDGQHQEETIQVGISELRACLALIQASDRPADHEQLDGIQKALGILAPDSAAPDASALAPLALAVEPSVAPSPNRADGKPGRQRRPTLALELQVVENQLLGLGAKLQFLHVVLTEPLFRSADASAADAELQKHVEAMRWLGAQRLPEILRAVDSAASLDDRLIAGAALIYLGAERGVDWLASILEKAAAARHALPELASTILSTFAWPEILDGMVKVFQRPAVPAVCGAFLPGLAEQNRIPSEKLWELANHDRDEVAIPAARALVWTDAGSNAPLLGTWVRQARTARRAHALLFAAAALGVPAALPEVRARLGQGAVAGRVDRCLVEALAIAGDRSDAALLIELAKRPSVDAEFVLLAAAGLGSGETVVLLPSLSDLVPAPVLDEAKRMIVGDDQAAVPTQAGPGPRLLHGQPWSVAAVLSRLTANDESLPQQRRLALELRVRTGLPLPSPWPTLAPPEARARAVAAWRPYFAKAQARLRPGDWYYHGKPAVLAGQAPL